MIRTAIRATLLMSAALLGNATAGAQTCPGDPGYTFSITENAPIGGDISVVFQAPPDSLVYALLSFNPGPVPTKYGMLCVGPDLLIVEFPMPASGVRIDDLTLACDPAAVGLTVYGQFVAFGPGPDDVGISNSASLTVLDGPCSPCGGTMGDFVFQDLNGNNVQDPGEPGIEGVEITLHDDQGNLLATTVTDALGGYMFDGLCGGTYTVTVDPDSVPDGLAPSLCDVGNDDAADSDCSPATATLVGDFDSDPTLDFGYAPCSECDGKVNGLTLQYLGDEAIDVEIEQKKDHEIVFDGTLEPGEIFTIVAAEFGDGGTFSTELIFHVPGEDEFKIHTSCSVAIGPGIQFGDYLVLAGSSKNGGLMCPLGNSVCDLGKPQTLTMRYTGDDCSATSHSQDDGKVECDGDPADAPLVRIVGYEGNNVYFDGEVALGETFVLDATAAGLDKFKSATFVDVYLPGGSSPVQMVEFHTSCSQDLFVDDQFGSLVLEGFTLDL